MMLPKRRELVMRVGKHSVAKESLDVGRTTGRWKAGDIQSTGEIGEKLRKIAKPWFAILSIDRFPDGSCVEVACACADGKTTCGVADAGADARDASGVDASCSGPAVGCAVGSSGGQCSDVGQLAPCINGQWTCPPYTIPFSQCKCVGAPPPGCSCGSSGWSCPTSDGGH